MVFNPANVCWYVAGSGSAKFFRGNFCLSSLVILKMLVSWIKVVVEESLVLSVL